MVSLILKLLKWKVFSLFMLIYWMSNLMFRFLGQKNNRKFLKVLIAI